MLLVLFACHSTSGQVAEGATNADYAQTAMVSESSSRQVEEPEPDFNPRDDQTPCHHPRYVTRKGAKVLLLLVETPGLFALVPTRKGDANPPVVYSTGDLGYAPEMTPVLPGEIARVYQCNGDGWAYLGDLDVSGFNNEGGRVTHLTIPKLGGGTNQVPWVAEGPLIKPKRE